MNNLKKRKIGIKRKEIFNKKLAVQVMFSIMLVALVIFTKQIDSGFSKKFISVTEKKLSENIDPSVVTGVFKNVIVGVRDKIPFISKNKNIYASPVNGKIYKDYGLIENENSSYYNHGIDIVSNTKTIKSISKGIVILVGKNEQLSNYVVVQEEDKKIIYGKINETLVSKGDKLSKGDIIGALSEDEKILHLEIWENGESINPSKLFKISN